MYGQSYQRRKNMQYAICNLREKLLEPGGHFGEHDDKDIAAADDGAGFGIHTEDTKAIGDSPGGVTEGLALAGTLVAVLELVSGSIHEDGANA